MNRRGFVAMMVAVFWPFGKARASHIDGDPEPVNDFLNAMAVPYIKEQIQWTGKNVDDVIAMCKKHGAGKHTVFAYQKALKCDPLFIIKQQYDVIIANIGELICIRFDNHIYVHTLNEHTMFEKRTGLGPFMYGKGEA